MSLNDSNVTNAALDWELPKPVRSGNGDATEMSELDDALPHDPNRYDGWDLSQVRAGLDGYPLVLLKRATLGSLIARREVGGLYVAGCSQITSRQELENLFRRHQDINYSDGRRHMKLWLSWDRIEGMLRDRERSCRRRGAPFIVPGYRHCLELAGLEGRSEAPPYEPPPPPVEAEPLPDDMEGLKKLLKSLRQENRLEREARTRLQVKLDLAQDEFRAWDSNAQPDAVPSRGICRSKGWLRRALPMIRSEQQSQVEIRIGKCLDQIEDEENIYHAAVTDAPYELGLHSKEWDSTGISFSNALWSRLFKVVRPGGYVAFFAAPRLYHRAAQAAEDVGFDVMPFLVWRYFNGLAKPANVSELFDRDNLDQREVVGVRRGSGMTKSNVVHGAQNRTHTVFAASRRYVSEEAIRWRGYYHGKNALKPCIESILLVQKPISEARMIDNVRIHGCGALNIGALQDRYDEWPSNMFTYRKADKSERLSDHPCVKPVSLIQDLCLLVCPAGGRILDPFGGTGTTAIAARACGFDCVLIEQDPTMERVIRERLARMS